MEEWFVTITGYIFGAGMVVSFICAAWAIPALFILGAWNWWKSKYNKDN